MVLELFKINLAWLRLRKDVTSTHWFHVTPSPVLFPCAQFLWGPQYYSGLLIWLLTVQKKILFEIRYILGQQLTWHLTLFWVVLLLLKNMFGVFCLQQQPNSLRRWVFLGEERKFSGTSPSLRPLCFCASTYHHNRLQHGGSFSQEAASVCQLSVKSC